MKTAADNVYWSEMWGKSELRYEPHRLGFTDLFAKYISHGGDCFEIGCYPGGNLIYLSTHFSLKVHGIDMYPGTAAQLPLHLAQNGATVGQILHGDFFDFAPGQGYDVVCSFGFVEHFYNYREVLKKHVELVKPGGLLIVTCPNFRRFQFLLHWLFDYQNLQKHVLAAMNLEAWNETLAENGMVVLDSGFYGRFLFWVETSSKIKNCLARWINVVGGKAFRRFKFPNSYLSPFMYCVARKPVD